MDVPEVLRDDRPPADTPSPLPPPDPRGTSAPAPGPARLGAADRLPILLMVVLVLAGAAMVGAAQKTFSPVDEIPHFDYVVRLVENHRMPQRDEQVSVTTDRYIACYGPLPYRKSPISCAAPTSELRTWGTGIVNTAGGYPPLYYAGVAAAAVVLEPFTGNLLVAARLASALWLALGVVACYLLCRTAGAGRPVSFALSLAAGLAPLMLFQGSMVNPDAASMLCGAGAVLAWLRLRDRPGRWPIVWLGLVVLGTAMIKPNLLPIPVSLVAAELALTARLRGFPALRRWRTWTPAEPLGRVVLACGGGAAVGFLWSVAFLVLTPPAHATVASKAFGDRAWSTMTAIRSLVRAFSPLEYSLDFAPLLTGSLMTVLATLIGRIALGGAIAAALMGHGRERVDRQVQFADGAVDPVLPIGYAAAWALVLAAPVTYAVIAASGHFFPYQARYGLWLVPTGLAAAAGLAGRRGSQVLTGIGLLAAAATLVRLVHTGGLL